MEHDNQCSSHCSMLNPFSPHNVKLRRHHLTKTYILNFSIVTAPSPLCGEGDFLHMAHFENN
jgi:hypothetical protein